MENRSEQYGLVWFSVGEMGEGGQLEGWWMMGFL